MSAIVCSQETGGQGKGERPVPNPIPILNTAFLGILTWDFEKNHLPEVCDIHNINCIICCLNSKQFLFLYFRL